MKTQLNEWGTTTRKNVRHLAYWTFGWALTLAPIGFGAKFIWDYNPIISTVFIVINTLVGIGMILMNRKYMKGLDEMHREITLDAMAIALGVGVVAGISYSMLDIANVISFDAEIGPLVGLMGLTYFIAHVVGQIRYK